MPRFWPTSPKSLPFVRVPALEEKYNTYVALTQEPFPEDQEKFYRRRTGLPEGESLNVTYCIHGTRATDPTRILSKGLRWQYLTRIGRCGMGLYAAVENPHYSFWGYMHRVEAANGVFVHVALILRIALPEKHLFQVERTKNIDPKYNYELPDGKFFTSVDGYAGFVDEFFRENYTALDALPPPNTDYGTVICVRELSAVDIAGIIAFAPKDSEQACNVAKKLTFHTENPQPALIEISDDDDEAGPPKKTQKVQGFPTCVYCNAKGPQVERIRNPKYHGDGGACGGWCSANSTTWHYYGATCPNITYVTHPVTQLRVPTSVTSTGQKVMIVHMNGLDIPNNQRGFAVTKNGKSASVKRWESQAHGHYFSKIGNFYDILAVAMN